MLRDVHLHGALGEEFGKKHQFDVTNMQQVISALSANFGTRILKAMRDYDYDIRWKRKNGEAVGEDMLYFTYPDGAYHIIPVPKGSAHEEDAGPSRGKSTGKIIMSIVLIALSFYVAGPVGGEAAAEATLFAQTITIAGHTANQFLFTTGLLMGMQGVSGLLAPTPSFDNEAKEQEQAFLFNGPVNVGGEGQTIPVVYGRFRVGTVVVSSGIETVDVYVNARTGNSGGGHLPFNYPVVKPIDLSDYDPEDDPHPV